MKTKNKTVALMEIAIVLCSVFLVALPPLAAEQNQEMQKASASDVTTSSEDDYVLGIYGNANEDDTIDMGDVVYTKLAIFGKKPKTELCDAKYDGRINVLDVIQTKLIILGKEKELTVIDDRERIVTVNKPVRRIVSTWRNYLETLRTLKVPKDKIVGVERLTVVKPEYDLHFLTFFPEFMDVPSVGYIWRPDVEAILNMNPDVVFIHTSPGHGGASPLDVTTDTLESVGIIVLRFNCGPGRPSPGQNTYPENVKKLGYIFDKEDEAEEFIDWYESIMNPIIEKAGKIPDEDKPKVYGEHATPYHSYEGQYPSIATSGGKDILPGAYGSVDPEAVVAQNPEIIVKVAGPFEATGYYLAADDTTEIEKVREEIMSRPEFQEVKAIKEGKVYVISKYIIYSGHSTSGCRSFLQTLYQAKWFHPELFKDLDPKAIHQEYLTRFQGLDIDLDEKGVFVYPKPS